MADAIPSSAGECQPGSATFTFYFIGDQNADHVQLVVDGSGSIGLPAGNYEIVEEGTQAHYIITVWDGVTNNLVVLNPTDDPLPTIPADQGTVNIAKFYCDNIDEVVWQSAIVDDFQAVAELPSSEGACAAGPATFTFYLERDGTAEYAQIVVDGAGTIGLPDGVYEVVEEETQSHYEIEVIAGRITTIVVMNPVPDQPTPTATATSVPPTATPTKKPHDHKPTATMVAVKELPKTGNGASEQGGMNGSSALILVAASSLLLAGAWEMRRRRVQ